MDKSCVCCGQTPRQPSWCDVAEKRELRKWALPNWWGPLCWWCVRMAAVRFGYFNPNAFAKFVSESPEQRKEAALAALAYLTLRSDGRTHVKTEQIDDRTQMLRHLAVLLPDVMGMSNYETVPLAIFKKTGSESGVDNPIAKGYEIVQILLGGKRRLGVRRPIPQSLSDRLVCNGLEKCVIGKHVYSDVTADVALLEELASAVEAPNMMLAAPPPKAKQRRVSSPGGGECKGEALSDDDIAAEAADDQSAETAEEGQESRQEVGWPKGRLGTNVKKQDSKVGSIMATLATPQWEMPLREASLRALRRSTAGIGQELLRSEHPHLIQTNSDHTMVVGHLLDLVSALNQLKKEEKTKNLLAVAKPIADLLEYAMKRKGGKPVRFDCEIMVLQALSSPVVLLYATRPTQRQT